MSSANLELVRSAFAAYERGDLLATLDWADPGIEFVMVGFYWERDRAFADLGLSPEGDVGDPSG